MPIESRASVAVPLSVPDQWVLLEEVWKDGFWVDNNRELEVPPGVRVSFRHNFMWPFWHWETGLGEGRHGFYIADGWNKFQVRLDTPGIVTAVLWIF